MAHRTATRCRSLRRVMALALALALPAGYARAATLTVGPGQGYTTIAAAVAASRDGDTVEVLSGVYVNDYAEIRTKIALFAVGGAVKLLSQGFIPNGKGILITDTDVSITGFTFTGARVPAAVGGNAAGIRYQGGNLTLSGCYFVNNQNGILGAPDPVGTITIFNSEFAHNGVTSGPSSGYTHNLYIGNIARLDIENSYIHDANVGHQIKSRAQVTIVNNTRVVDGPTGTSSYSIDAPNGGAVTITNDQIEQGPLGQNPVIISFGEEGGIYPNSALTVQNTLIENDMAARSLVGVRNSTTLVIAQVSGSRSFGLTTAQLTAGPVSVSSSVLLTTEPAISTRHPWLK